MEFLKAFPIERGNSNETVSKFGKIDALINNAAIVNDNLLLNMNDD
jgi:NAD(P)-dependent dehydrogenase (short-subunit alcohol dehydrogenase family)